MHHHVYGGDEFAALALDAAMAEADTHLHEAKRRRAAVRDMMT
jgi:hypothetical protein